MKYRNIKTGAVIDIKSKIIGGDWKEVVTKKPQTKRRRKENEQLRDN